MARKGMLLSLSMGLALLLIMSLFWLLTPASATTGVAELRVCPSGCPYQSIQAAVDAASPGAIIKVATGVYTGVNVRPRRDYIMTGVVTQVVYISKTVTIRGGYTTAFAEPPNPEANPTTLDAQGKGRVLYITGNVSPTLFGLRITRGKVSGFNNGGGIYAITAMVVISQSRIFSNTAGLDGGGISLDENASVFLMNNQIYSNTAAYQGGGVSLSGVAQATLTGNDVFNNTAGMDGGGIYLSGIVSAVLAGNRIFSNSAAWEGGSLSLRDFADAVVTDNTIYGNVAGLGGGGGVLLSEGEAAMLRSNYVFNNTAGFGDGGGIRLDQLTGATLVDNRVYNNATESSGGGIFLSQMESAILEGNCVYDNKGGMGNGGGISLDQITDARLTANYVYGNRAEIEGGGAYFSQMESVILGGNYVYSNISWLGTGGLYIDQTTSATLIGNRVYSNATTYEGGGLALIGVDDAALTGNHIFNNTAARGGGLYLLDGSMSLTNTVITDNRATGSGSGLLVGGGTAHLLHTTIARNEGGDGSTIYITQSQTNRSTVVLTNTVLVSSHIGISVTTGNTATIKGVLWYATPITVSGGATATTKVQNQFTGDPAFAADGYHLRSGSAAIDRGIAAGVTADIDGEPRPYGPAPDLGADEYRPAAMPGRRVYLPLTRKQSRA